jgi:hypothetical protein
VPHRVIGVIPQVMPRFHPNDPGDGRVRARFAPNKIREQDDADLLTRLDLLDLQPTFHEWDAGFNGSSCPARTGKTCRLS